MKVIKESVWKYWNNVIKLKRGWLWSPAIIYEIYNKMKENKNENKYKAIKYHAIIVLSKQ